MKKSFTEEESELIISLIESNMDNPFFGFRKEDIDMRNSIISKVKDLTISKNPTDCRDCHKLFSNQDPKEKLTEETFITTCGIERIIHKAPVPEKKHYIPPVWCPDRN